MKYLLHCWICKTDVIVSAATYDKLTGHEHLGCILCSNDTIYDVYEYYDDMISKKYVGVLGYPSQNEDDEVNDDV